MTEIHNDEQVRLEPKDLPVVLELFKAHAAPIVAAEMTERKGSYITDQQVYAFLRNAKKTMLKEINTLIRENRTEEARQLVQTVENMFPNKRQKRSQALNAFMLSQAGINIKKDPADEASQLLNTVEKMFANKRLPRGQVLNEFLFSQTGINIDD